jgi:hypothetical protein
VKGIAAVEEHLGSFVQAPGPCPDRTSFKKNGTPLKQALASMLVCQQMRQELTRCTSRYRELVYTCEVQHPSESFLHLLDPQETSTEMPACALQIFSSKAEADNHVNSKLLGPCPERASWLTLVVWRQSIPLEVSEGIGEG